MQIGQTETLVSSLPPLYAHWMAQALAEPLPTETKATCDNCAMCAKSDQSTPTSLTFFNPKIKCCTYMPDLHNFLVGRILAEPNPDFVPGRAALEARLEAGFGVTPFGLAPSPTQALLYNNSLGFGRAETLRCPYYIEEGGKCGVWRHRDTVCSTWFCKHNRGATGLNFWQHIQHLLSTVEDVLTNWCVAELDLGLPALQILFQAPQQALPRIPLSAAQLDGQVDRPVYQRIWGRWLGRERNFYLECARLVGGLKWSEVLAIGGPELPILLRLTRQAQAELASQEIPPYLQPGAFRVLQNGPERCLVESYRAYQPVEIPRWVLNVLYYFDGQRSTEETLGLIEAEQGFKLSLGLVRRLADFQILLAADGPMTTS